LGLEALGLKRRQTCKQHNLCVKIEEMEKKLALGLEALGLARR
jgi:hypothetical protein